MTNASDAPMPNQSPLIADGLEIDPYLGGFHP
jgi:hypothetical protein